MKKFKFLPLLLLLCAGANALVVDVSAETNSRKRKESAAPKPDKTEIEKLIELTRRASEAAESAQAEARRSSACAPPPLDGHGGPRRSQG